MAKISAILVVFFCSLSFSYPRPDSVKIYSFSIADSNLIMKRDGRKFTFHVCEYKGGVTLTTYLPGTGLAAEDRNLLWIEAEYKNIKISTWAESRIEIDGAVRETKLIFPASGLLYDFETKAYPGIMPAEHSLAEVVNFLQSVRNFQIVQK
jgi:hypothetical protein